MRPVFDSDYSVAVRRCMDYSQQSIRENLLSIFSLLGGVSQFIKPGDTVLLKPNFIVPRSTYCPAQTHPSIIIETARIVKEAGGICTVGDSPAWNNIKTCAGALGLPDALEKLDVKIQPLAKSKTFKICETNIKISTHALEANKIINLPKLKAHQQLGATFAIKNMFGCVPGKQKAYLHFSKGKIKEEFANMLIEIYKLLNPTLNIIDGITAMEGQGPISGTAKHIGALIAGRDPIACELVCAKLTKLNIESLPIVQTAFKNGFGCDCFESIQLLGDNISQLICPDFMPAQQAPINFSFPRVCKSVAKQIVLLAKSRFLQKNI